MLLINSDYLIMGNHVIKRDGSKIIKANFDILDYKNNILIKEKLMNSGILSPDKDYLSEDLHTNLVIKENHIFNNMRLFIQITNKCNLKCKHCFAESSFDEQDEMQLDDVINILDEAIDLGIWRIDFTGGEIFIKDYFYDVLEYIKFKPISSLIFTNLTLLNDNNIDSIIRNPAIREIITSIDYFIADKHNEFRGGMDAFSKTLNNVNKLNNKGKKVTVNTMVLNDNHDDILEMINYFIPKGIDMHFDTVINCGRAKCYKEDGSNQDKENVNFIASCAGRIQKLKNNKYKTIDSISCGVGENLIFLNNHNRFQVCPGINENVGMKYYLGEHIIEAYQNLKKLNLNCDVKHCKYYENCSYGCKIRSMLYHNSVNGPDDVICYFNRIKEERLNV